MKKKTLRLLVCTALTVVALSFNACGDGKESKDTSEDSTSVSESVVDDSKTDSTSESTDDDSNSLAGLGKYDSVADYVNSDLIQNQISSIKESLAESGMDMEVTGEDNKLIYTYTYSELTQVDGMADALASGLDAQADTFKSVAKSLKAAVDEENPVVVVRYMDANGDEIYSQEFTAE